MITSSKSRSSLIATLSIISLLGAGCSVPYYWQATAGQMRIVNGREPIERVLEDPELLPELRERLKLSQDALAFAHAQLLLPDNGSYTTYFDTGQPYVVWNVFAAPEFSLTPQTWCFPVAGCIAYRGYFKQERARKYARELGESGADIYVGGVAAYSTLGRFRDPVLNTMLDMEAASFTGLLFHELAHQLLYVQDDSAFNEGFATAVENEGLRRWLRARNMPAELATDADDRRQITEVMTLLEVARARLEQLYTSDLPIPEKRLTKQELLADMQIAYGALADKWAREGLRRQPYGQLFASGLNNASLGAIATYADYVPAFNYLLNKCGGELECFYTRATELGELDPAERHEQIERLLAMSDS